MPCPRLEMLEARLAPAVLQGVPGGDALPVVEVVGQAARVLVVRAPEGFSAPPAFAPAASDEAFFAPPPPPDPLMTGIGRLPEPSLDFPASGGGDPDRPPEEPGSPPADAPEPTPPPTEQDVDAVFTQTEAEAAQE